MMIRALIIDDEKHCIVTLEHLLNKTGEVEILETIQNSQIAVDKIKSLMPDIVFIDIQMPHPDGFEILNQFEELPFKVVFTTAYDEYAIRALKMNALDYLQKPISYEDVQGALDKYKNRTIINSKEQIDHVYRFTKENNQDIIALSVQEGLLFINVEEIMYVEGDGGYSQFVLKDQTKLLSSKNISVIEDVLAGNPLFFRAHKSHIVNLKYMRQYIRGDGGEVVMKDGKTITISRNKKQDFLGKIRKI